MLALFPMFLFVMVVIIIIIAYFIYRKVKRSLTYTYKKGAEIATEQQRKWNEKEQRKKVPIIVQKGFDDYDALFANVEQLPQEWRSTLGPLIEDAKSILDEVASDSFDNPSSKKLSNTRPFFQHTLNAMLQFSETIKSENKVMTNEQVEKARQNLILFKADLIHQKEILDNSRKFDFDVSMDVIKARIRK